MSKVEYDRHLIESAFTEYNKLFEEKVLEGLLSFSKDIHNNVKTLLESKERYEVIEFCENNDISINIISNKTNKIIGKGGYTFNDNNEYDILSITIRGKEVYTTSIKKPTGLLSAIKGVQQ
jgi:hypothetical protein